MTEYAKELVKEIIKELNQIEGTDRAKSLLKILIKELSVQVSSLEKPSTSCSSTNHNPSNC